MRKGFRPDLRLAKGTALDVPKKSAGSKTGSKRAVISGYSERRTAIRAPGKATSSHIVPQAEFIWHARGQGFESPKLNVGSSTELPVSYRQNCGGALIFSMTS